MSQAGRVAIITGGAQGIGRAIARWLGREGAAVVLADLQRARGEAEVAELEAAGVRALFVTANVGDPADIESMVARTLERFGRVDILINNAYESTPGNAEAVDAAAWDAGFNVMVRSMSLAARAVVPSMREHGGGSIVNLASVHGLLAATDSVIYETCKHAVIGITRAMAVDFGPDNIRVNAICPGAIITEVRDEQWQADRAGALFSESLYPLRRVGRPDDIAGAVGYLVSAAAAFVTGHALVVDGGLSVQLQDSLARRLHDQRRADDIERPLRTRPLPDQA